MKGRQTLRIIGGEWRGRRLRFPEAEGLRPTGDRVRETVFNWLQMYVPGARCLDLFAGSGAMGLEAASRGARLVVMVDQAPAVCDSLRENATLLNARQAEVRCTDAMRLLDGPAQAFDVVFLDPPFDSAIIGACCARLEERGWLSAEALIYIEVGKSQGLPALPANWKVIRERQAGRVAFYLAQRRFNAGEGEE